MHKGIKTYLWIAGILVVLLLIIRGCSGCGCGRDYSREGLKKELNRIEVEQPFIKYVGQYLKLGWLSLWSEPYRVKASLGNSKIFRDYYLSNGPDEFIQQIILASRWWMLNCELTIEDKLNYLNSLEAIEESYKSESKKIQDRYISASRMPSDIFKRKTELDQKLWELDKHKNIDFSGLYKSNFYTLNHTPANLYLLINDKAVLWAIAQIYSSEKVRVVTKEGDKWVFDALKFEKLFQQVYRRYFDEKIISDKLTPIFQNYEKARGL